MGQVKAVAAIDLSTVTGIALMCACTACKGSGTQAKPPNKRVPHRPDTPIPCLVCKGAGSRSVPVTYAQFQQWLVSQAAPPAPAPSPPPAPAPAPTPTK